MRVEWQESETEADQICLMVEEKLWRVCSKKLFCKHIKALQRAASPAQLQEEWLLLEQQVAYQELLRYLSWKGYFSCQLREKLQKKWFSSQAIDSAIARCEKVGYLNDRERAEQLAAALQAKGKGPRFIELEVKRRSGVQLSLGEAREEQREAVLLFLSKNRGKSREQLMRALARRGFDFAIIRELVGEGIDE